MTPARSLATLVAALAALPATAQAGLPVSAYARAEALDKPSVRGLVTNELVVPRWIGASDEFWYRKETSAGGRFVIVDAATGRSRPAFDHAAVAKAIGASTGAVVEPERLPFEEIDLGADGRSLAFSIEKRAYRCASAPVDCRPVETAASPVGAVPSPDGRWAVFERDANLWLRDLGTGAERALTDDGVANFGYGIYVDGWKADFVARRRGREAGNPPPPMETSWSPDSRKILVPRVDQRHVAEYPLLETVPHDGSYRTIAHPIRLPLVGERPPALDWFVIDRESGARRRLELPYTDLLVVQQDLLAIRRTWWSADGRRLFAVAFGAEMRSAWLFDADLESGAVRTVVHEELLPRTDLNSTSYNPPNVWISPDGAEAIWFSQRDGWGHLYRYDGRSGKLLNRITEGSWLVRDLVAVDEKARRIYFTGAAREGGNPYYRYLYRVGFDGGDLTLLSPEPADHMISSPYNDVLAIDGGASHRVLSPSGRYVVYNHSTPSRPTESVIRRTADGALVATFEKADASALFAAGFEAPEEVKVKAADGATDLWCVLYRPHGFRAEGRYPVLDVQYASPLTAVAPRNFLMAMTGPSSPSAPSSYAALGLAVAIVDGRGTTFRSRDFAHAIFGRLHLNGLDDHVAAIRQLAAARPWMDLNRVGVIGRSYGGWSTFRAMLEFPEFFKVGVAGAAPGSMHSQYVDYHWSAMHGPPVYADGSERIGSPAEVPTNWNVLDGRQQTERLAGKLLVIHGELDENVLIGSTMQFLHALQKADKDFDLIWLADQNHYFTGNPYVTRRVWDFLVRNLLGAEPPAYRVTDRRPPAP